MTTADRIKKRMAELRIKGVDITRATGASSGTISNWKNGVNSPHGHYLVSLAKLLQCSPDWLITGSGGGVNEAPNTYNITPIRDDLIKSRIPLITWEQAIENNKNPGRGATMTNPTRTVYATKTYHQQAFALSVPGESMHDPHNPRSFPPGCYIVIDPTATPAPGDFVVYTKNPANPAADFKQLTLEGGTQYLKPLNPRYPIIELTDDITIIGVVKERIIHDTY